jgi:HEAT repeat protein
LTELRSSEQERRSSAADNLVAIGTAAAHPVATLLVRTESDDTIRHALDALRRLGKHATPAAPAIADALLALPAPHPPAVLRALAAVVPWSTDVLMLPFMSWSVGRLIIHGRDVEGTIDAALIDDFTAAERELLWGLAVRIKASAEELEKFLESPMGGVRKRALEVIGGRGIECETMLLIGPSDHPLLRSARTRLAEAASK